MAKMSALSSILVVLGYASAAPGRHTHAVKNPTMINVEI